MFAITRLHHPSFCSRTGEFKAGVGRFGNESVTLHNLVSVPDLLLEEDLGMRLCVQHADSLRHSNRF